MRTLFFILIAIASLSSCKTVKSLRQQKQAVDSTVNRTVDSAVVKKASLVVTEKTTTYSEDSVHTKDDSAKSQFSYVPGTNDTVQVEVESGTVSGTLVLHPATGKGKLTVHKKAETIPVPRTTEQTRTMQYQASDSSTMAVDEKTALNKKTAEKTKDKEVTRIPAGVYIAGFLLLLLILLYFWLKRQYTHPRRVLP